MEDHRYYGAHNAGPRSSWHHFFGHSIQYASYLLNRLPPRDLLDTNGDPTTPHFLAFDRKPRMGHLRVFGCPVAFKRYNPSTADGGLTKKQQSQRASTRGIFIGIPPKQAGYLIYLEDRIGSAHILVSHDVIFDEEFKSAVAASMQPFQGARFIRPAGTHALEHNFDDANMEHTGSVSTTYFTLLLGRGGRTMITLIRPLRIPMKCLTLTRSLITRQSVVVTIVSE